MKIPKNIEKGVTRIAAVAAVLALIVGFAVGARLYYKANSQYGLAVDDRGGLKGEWVRPGTVNVIETGMAIGIAAAALTFLGVYGAVHLGFWVYEGFKKGGEEG